MRDKQANEFHLPLTSVVAPKRKQEKVYLPLDFENNLTVDAFVDSRAYVSGMAKNDLDPKKPENSEESSQNRQPSQLSNTSSQWPVRKTISNNHTYI